MNDGCEICRRRSAAVVSLGKHVICTTCAGAIGRHFGTARPPSEQLDAAVRAQLEALKRGAQPTSPRDDAVTHLDLALAHSETGNLSDAAGEAATALAHGTKLEAHQTLQALAIVLHPKVQGRSLSKTIDALRTSLYRD